MEDSTGESGEPPTSAAPAPSSTPSSRSDPLPRSALRAYRSFMNFRVQHIALDVDDLAAAIAFYTDGLGFTIAPRPAALGEGGVWLDIGDERQLHLVESAAFEAPATSQHLALGVDDCDAAIAELRGRGLDVGDAFDVGAGRQAFLRDPAGNLLELNEPA